MSRDRSNPSNRPDIADDGGVDSERRRVLWGLGVGAGGAVLLAGGVTPADAGSEPVDERRRSRYRVTEHVERFYALNRL